MLSISKLDYHGWEAYQLENRDLAIIIAPEIGGRVVSFSDKKREILYTIPKLRGKTYDLTKVADIREYRKQLDYLPIGGYKTWLAPQSSWGWPPYLDLAVGKYEIKYQKLKDRIEFEVISPICRESKIQLSRKIVVPAENKRVIIEQKMKNCGAKEKQYGLWDVTQVKGNGRVVMPISSEEEIINLMEEDSKRYIEILEVANTLYAVINCPGEVEFKVGTSFSVGWILSLISEAGEKVGYLKRFPVFREAEFGHGCAVEVFDTYKFNYFEVEVHGPMNNLSPEEEAGFNEEWELYIWNNNRSLSNIIKYIST